jgi:prepilin-type N-terminal cleavage/methylation domain-containing protein
MNIQNRQKGFTLVEIAIVLVIIGLLLGGILKGQELINSARVRNLADTNSGIQAAYYGFIDRYRSVPGDMDKDDATNAIGTTITVGGDKNGQLGNSPAGAADPTDGWGEVSAAWTHMTLAGFLQGTYAGGATDAATYASNDLGPQNPFGGYYLLGRTKDYSTTTGEADSGNVVRLALVFGDNIPVEIARELDVKIDDQQPRTGDLRFTGTSVVTYGAISTATTQCVTSSSPFIWDIANQAQNCNLIYLY